jgi:hypothetical protein
MNNEDISDILEDVCDNANTLSAFDNDEYSCSCGFDESMPVFPENATLAQSYVPYQYMDETFKPCVGLKMGTIFPELVSPYVPCQSIEEIEFIKATNKIGKRCNR